MKSSDKKSQSKSNTQTKTKTLATKPEGTPQSKSFQPQLEEVTNPVGHSQNVGSRRMFKWGESDIWSPDKCLPYAVNNRALANETSLVRLHRVTYKAKEKTGVDKDGKQNLWVQTNGIKTPLDSNTRSQLNKQSRFNRMETMTVQQVSQIENTSKHFKVMIKNAQTLGNFGAKYESVTQNHNYHEMEARMANNGLKFMDLLLKDREEEDNTINNIDRAVNPQATQELFTQHGIPVLPAYATTLSFWCIF